MTTDFTDKWYVIQSVLSVSSVVSKQLTYDRMKYLFPNKELRPSCIPQIVIGTTESTKLTEGTA